MSDRTSAGRRLPLVDGIEKVTGRAAYTADLQTADALIGRILRSPVSHGILRNVDVAEALALDGVRAIITGADCAYTYGVLPIAMNEYPMAREKVRYRGERHRATITAAGERWSFAFDEPQPRPAPGQALVMYDGPSVLGGGTIVAADRVTVGG